MRVVTLSDRSMLRTDWTATREIARLDELQAALPADAALVAWVDESSKSGGVNEHWGCVLGATGEPAWIPLAGTGPDGLWTKDDDSLPQRLRKALAEGAPLERVAALADELSQQRLKPLAEHLKDLRRVFIVGANSMAGIPVEALTDQFTISYVPSGTFLARLPEREPAREHGLLALGDPVFSGSKGESEQEHSNELPPGGLLITQVVPGGGAAQARLKAGDVLVRYADTELGGVEQLAAAMQAQAGAKEVAITVWREGEKQPFTRNVPPGKLGVLLDREPAREAIVNRRQTDAMLLAVRGGDWDDLPGTRVEVTQLAGLFGAEATTLVDSAASEQALEELRKREDGNLSQFRYLHFATHGETNDVRAFESALILAQDTLPAEALPRAGEPFINGQLSANEVLEFWKLNSDLVTLSACETALGRKGGGDGLLGFAQAFLAAGSRAVCLSLWKVDDTATSLLMGRFYQNLLGKREGLDGPMGKAAALAEAKRWLRELSAEEALTLSAAATNGVVRGARGKGEELNLAVPADDADEPAANEFKPFAHPRFWSAFILIGDPN